MSNKELGNGIEGKIIHWNKKMYYCNFKQDYDPQ